MTDRLEAAASALRLAKRAIEKAALDTLWCDDCPAETVCDRIDSALMTLAGQQSLPLTEALASTNAPSERSSIGEVREALRAALEPFADALGDDDDDEPDHTPATLVCGRSCDYSLDLGDFRAARAALETSTDAVAKGVDHG